MATDKSEPKVGLILGIGVLMGATLISVHLALTAYFDKMTADEVHRKYGEIPATALQSLRASERERLTAGPVPVAAAMQRMVAQGRASVSPEVAASSSRDTSPLAGWAKMPSEVPAAMLAPSSAPQAAAPSAADAGVARGPDAGPAARKNAKHAKGQP